MMDRAAAESMGLPIDRATKKVRYGSYIGPGGKETFYYGRVKGPISMKLSPEVTVQLPEIKVIEHGEPIILIGTDTLVDSEDPEWRFCWVGIHPVHRRGQWVFVRGTTG